MKFKQHYVPKSNLGTRKENVKLHTEMVNIVNFATGNDSKPSSLGSDVVSPNNDFDKEDSLDGMSRLVDDSQQASPI